MQSVSRFPWRLLTVLSVLFFASTFIAVHINTNSSDKRALEGVSARPSIKTTPDDAVPPTAIGETTVPIVAAASDDGRYTPEVAHWRYSYSAVSDENAWSFAYGGPSAALQSGADLAQRNQTNAPQTKEPAEQPTEPVEDVTPAPTCGGKAVTIFGTPGNDDILGTPGDDVISTGGGNDKIDGSGGNDIICGGPGDDNIDGSYGTDDIYGDSGNDTIAGSFDADVVHGGTGNDNITGSYGTDKLYGDAGNDTIAGEYDADYIEGGDGNDTITASFGTDEIHGGAGDDDIDGGQDADLIYGDAGNDTIIGDFGTDKIYGGAGNDNIDSGQDADYIEGGDGDDTINGGFGADILRGNAGTNTIDGGPDTDDCMTDLGTMVNCETPVAPVDKTPGVPPAQSVVGPKPTEGADERIEKPGEHDGKVKPCEEEPTIPDAAVTSGANPEPAITTT